ncbi:unnamed protein product, partial [Porites lobata]
MVGLWLRWGACAGNTCAEHDLCTAKLTGTADGSGLKEVSGMANLYDVKLETAVKQGTRYGKAKNIEECACPPEYTGTSCQQCARGYTRLCPGPEFSPCVLCFCNGHS